MCLSHWSFIKICGNNIEGGKKKKKKKKSSTFFPFGVCVCARARLHYCIIISLLWIFVKKKKKKKKEILKEQFNILFTLFFFFRKRIFFTQIVCAWQILQIIWLKVQGWEKSSEMSKTFFWTRGGGCNYLSILSGNHESFTWLSLKLVNFFLLDVYGLFWWCLQYLNAIVNFII